MIRGVNNCKLEENVICGIPDLFYPLGTQFSESIQQYIDAVPKTIAVSRLNIDFGTMGSSIAGGIDPTTGYTRRALFTYTGYDFDSVGRFLSDEETTKLMNTDVIAGKFSGVSEAYGQLINGTKKEFFTPEVIMLCFFVILSLYSTLTIVKNAANKKIGKW